jgi:hypothetical protein
VRQILALGFREAAHYSERRRGGNGG